MAGGFIGICQLYIITRSTHIKEISGIFKMLQKPCYYFIEILGAIAQLVEHLHGMQGVSGSSPLGSIRIFASYTN